MKAFILSVLLLSNVMASTDLTVVYQSIKIGDYQSAVTQLKKIKSQSKKILGTKNYLLGLSYARLQDFDNAIKFYKLAIKNGSNSADIYYELGQALYAMNELSRSRKAFLHSAKYGFKKAQSYYYVGHIFQLLDEHNNAKAFFKKSFKSKDVSTELRQIAHFQFTESLLHIARAKDKTAKYVEKYILPYMKKALKIKKKGSVATDIKKRIKQLEREYNLDPNLLISGRVLPIKRFTAYFSQLMSYDNNFTLTNDLPGDQQSKTDTYIFQTSLDVKYLFVFKRRYLTSFGIDLSNTLYSDREDEVVYSNDAYTIKPYLDISFEHKLFNNPASFLLEYDHKYNSQDNLGIKERHFSSRSNIYTIGEKFKFLNAGDTTIKYSFEGLKSFDVSLDNDKNTFSIDQTIAYKRSLFIILYLRTSSEYFNNMTNNTTVNLLRVDYIKPEIFANTTLNLGFSHTWLDFEDLQLSEAKGTETTKSFTTKLTRNVGKLTSIDIDYTYTTNDSKEEDSKYTKHATTFVFNINI